LFHMINLQFPKKTVLATIKMANLNTHEFLTLLNYFFLNYITF